eukprot:967988_1
MIASRITLCLSANSNAGNICRFGFGFRCFLDLDIDLDFDLGASKIYHERPSGQRVIKYIVNERTSSSENSECLQMATLILRFACPQIQMQGTSVDLDLDLG